MPQKKSARRPIASLAETAPAPPIAYRLPDAALASGLSIRTLYYAHDRGELPFRKVGARTLILRSDLEAFLATRDAA
jgi:hypothetical protein